MTPDARGAVLAIDQAMIALAVAKSALLGQTSEPIDLPAAGSSTGLPGTGNTTEFEVAGSSTKHGRYDAASAAEVAEGAEPGVQLPGEGSVDSLCPAVIPTRHGQYICTLDAGHTGYHEAHGTSPLPVWHDGDTEYGVDVSRLAPPAAYALPSIETPAEA